MRETLVRILKHGLPVAAVLAAFGYLLAQGAGFWVGSAPPARVADDGGDIKSIGGTLPPTGAELAAGIQTRLPFTLAAWGFGVVAVFELVLGAWRKAPPPTTPPAPAPGTDDELERLLAKVAAGETLVPAVTPPPPAPVADTVGDTAVGTITPSVARQP